jgi:hypothetical protein
VEPESRERAERALSARHTSLPPGSVPEAAHPTDEMRGPKEQQQPQLVYAPSGALNGSTSSTTWRPMRYVT